MPLGTARSPERDPGLTEDVLEGRDRIIVDLGLPKALDNPERAFFAKQPDHQRPVVLGRRILFWVVVDGNLKYRAVLALRSGGAKRRRRVPKLKLAARAPA
jgi:hypothetical protein